MFLVPETPGDGIATKHGGRVYLMHTPDALQTRIVRQDGRATIDLRPIDHLGKLALAVRALAFRTRA